VEGEIIMRAALSEALGDLRRTTPLDDENRLSDGELLERFVGVRDEAAFGAMVRRHGPMVLGVCRRVLRHHEDAEDAFQAAFLILARKAAGVRRESLGSWLYTVAYHAALEARTTSRRRAIERQVGEMPHPEVLPEEVQDWRPLLDRELHRLPEKYRAAVVLCDLEGKPRKAAARELGVPEGTLSSRLAMAHRMLARRLAKCGLSLSGATLAVGLAQSATAAVPVPLLSSTVAAAASIAAGGAAMATPAAMLMKGVLKTMFATKLKIVVATFLITAMIGAGGGIAYQAAGQSAPPREKSPDDVEALRKENELLRLNIQILLEKVRAQEQELAAIKGKTEEGVTSVLAPATPQKGTGREGHIMQSQNNLKQFALAFHNYHDTFRFFPPAAICDKAGKPLLSWRVAILPFIEQDALYKEFHLDEPWDSDHNKKVLDKMPAIYALPGVKMKEGGTTVYQVFVGKKALFDEGKKLTIANITDGTSNTVMIAEAATAVPWTKPEDIPFGDKDPRTQIGGWHGAFAQVALCDGSVRRIDLKKISEETLRNAIMPDDGNVLGKDW
jgi:RNA polymerase sigma factor (sigma-70 family)